MNPVRQLRLQFGLTQEELAGAGATSQPTIAAYETGKKSPQWETLQRLAKSLKAEVAVSFVPAMSRTDRRSLAYHQAIVSKLRQNPAASLKRARQNVHKMKRAHPHAGRLLKLWEQWLELPVNDLIGCCLDWSVLARDMRQVTPFAGILSARERAQVINKFRKEDV